MPSFEGDLVVLKEEMKGLEGEVFSAFGVDITTHRHQRCPFPEHEDIHPSFRVDLEKGVYFCSCSAGDVFSFVMRIAGCTFPQSIVLISEIIGVTTDVSDDKIEEIRKKREEIEKRNMKIDEWHNKACLKIGMMREENGPPPRRGELPTFSWILREIEIDNYERYVDWVHQSRGGGYIAPRNSFSFVRKIVKNISEKELK